VTLELKEVSLRVEGQTHIHATSLVLAERGFNTLLGETLAGKTTLLRLMAGLVKPSGGELWFGGRNVTGVPVQQRRVSMVYQQFINYPNLSVFDNIASPLRVGGTKPALIKERVGRIAELLKLSPLLDRKPSELSGGQQQRTALARALVKESELVLLDEPLATSCRACLPAKAASSSTRRPSRAKRCCSAARWPRCTRGASRSTGRRPRSTASRRI